MSNTKSNDPGSNDQSPSRSRFQGLARFGGDSLSRKAARVIAIVSRESNGPEPGDPADDVNFTMDLFLEVVMELNTGIARAYSHIKYPERRVEKIRIVCEEFLIVFLSKRHSRIEWHGAKYGGSVEKVPGQWRVCFVVPDLINLLDIAARLLEIGEHKSPHMRLIDRSGERNFLFISDGIATRYREKYKRIEPLPIKLALSKLFYCLRGWGLDHGLENANHKDKNQQKEQQKKLKSEVRGSFGGSQSHDQSNRDDPRDIRPYRIIQGSGNSRAEGSWGELNRNEFSQLFETVRHAEDGSQWTELPAGKRTGQPAQNLTWANVVAGHTARPTVQNLANTFAPAGEDVDAELSDLAIWDELHREIEGVVESGFTELLGQNSGTNVEENRPGSSTKGFKLRPNAPVFTPGMPNAPVDLDAMDLDEGMCE